MNWPDLLVTKLIKNSKVLEVSKTFYFLDILLGIDIYVSFGRYQQF